MYKVPVFAKATPRQAMFKSKKIGAALLRWIISAA